MITRYQLPRFIERGVATTLTMDVYNDAGTQQTASAGTFTLYKGGTALLDAVAVSSLGPPASYSLTAGTTTGETLADNWLEVWALTAAWRTSSGARRI